MKQEQINHKKRVMEAWGSGVWNAGGSKDFGKLGLEIWD